MNLLIGSKHLRESDRHAVVIGSGPNGLAAAIVLAKAGYTVEVFEAQEVPGGGVRTLPLTLPGFVHDFGSAIHPLAIGSPFFASLPLQRYGLEWIHPSAPVTHPMDDGTTVVLEHDFRDAEAAFGIDGKRWRGLFEPFARQWPQLAEETLQPLVHLPRHPFLMARFGALAVMPARTLANLLFKSPRTRALFAGISAHSVLSLDAPLSASAGLLLSTAAHAGGWPMPRGGAQAITNALISYLNDLGGVVHTNARVSSLVTFPPKTLFLCDVSPRQLLTLAGERLSNGFQQTLRRFRLGPGAFKLDYALSEPIPWKAAECRRSGTVHLGGTLEEVANGEDAVARGRVPERPFVLLGQPTLLDPTRAPEGKHVAWAYCHVPNGSTVDMTDKIEAQIERFAPGFRDCILARHILSPSILESMNANLIGGDFSGGAMTIRQTFIRPSWYNYATSDPNIYLCSSYTPGMGGVHGMCGYNAATLALSRRQRS
jgi:phytoene dehydrogenase-like protein